VAEQLSPLGGQEDRGQLSVGTFTIQGGRSYCFKNANTAHLFEVRIHEKAGDYEQPDVIV